MSDFDSTLVHIEICQKMSSNKAAREIQNEVEIYLNNLTEVPLDKLLHDTVLSNDIEYVRCCLDDMQDKVPFFPREVTKVYHVYQNWDDDPGMDFLDHKENAAFASLIWCLPNVTFEGLWESLIFNNNLKKQVISYVETTLLYASKKVNSQIVHWNGIILLHGQPGTGKTSLCKALAQKIAIRLDSKYRNCQLVEISTHSLFSKWFSESPKLVTKMFESLKEKAECKTNFICVLIDEVESLTQCRGGNKSDPSDSIRVVNAVLTQIDRLQRYPNILIMATSNLMDTIDLAFADRADLKIYCPSPCSRVSYTILKSCIEELIRCGLVLGDENDFFEIYIFEKMKNSDEKGEGEDIMAKVLKNSQGLYHISKRCEYNNISARQIRKIPFLTSAEFVNKPIPNITEFLSVMEDKVCY